MLERYTYEIAPVFVLMEEEVLSKLRALVGWTSGDGVFCPGGSISNMYALNLARYHRYPECKQRGLRALPPLALFSSEECHYSIKKGAAFLGLGTDSVRVVKADERGKMVPEDLERQIRLAEAEFERQSDSAQETRKPRTPSRSLMWVAASESLDHHSLPSQACEQEAESEPGPQLAP